MRDAGAGAGAARRVEFDPERLVGSPSRETVCMLLGADPAACEPDDANAGAIGCELAMRLLSGLQLEYLAAGAKNKRREKGDLSVPGQELSAATNLHPVSASCRTDLACSVVTRLPMTLKLMEAGILERRHAEEIERATRELSVDQARQVDAAAVPGGPLGLRKRVADAVAKAAPGLLEKKAEKAEADRDVTFWTDGIEGTGGVEVTGPVDKIAQIKAAIDSRARKCSPEDTRPLAARRFDVLFDWARTVLGLPLRDRDGHPAGSEGATGSAGTPPGACTSCGRAGPSTIPISVTISLEALLHLSEAPGDLDGLPIPASVARDLAGDGRWRRFVTEPLTGKLLDAGANSYRPTERVLRFVRGRDRRCIFPGCSTRAERCDCDHTRAYHTAGGKTVVANLGPLCRSHHRCKHELDWSYHRDPTDHLVWTAPSGRRYVTEPEYYADDPHLSAVLSAQSERRERRRKAAEERKAAEDRAAAGRRIANPKRYPGTEDPWNCPVDPDDDPPF